MLCIQLTITMRALYVVTFTPLKKYVKEKIHRSVFTKSHFRRTGYASPCRSLFHIESNCTDVKPKWQAFSIFKQVNMTIYFLLYWNYDWYIILHMLLSCWIDSYIYWYINFITNFLYIKNVWDLFWLLCWFKIFFVCVI